MKKLVIILILLLLPISYTYAEDIYVTTPVTVNTINTAIASAVAGDTVIIPDGIYTLGLELASEIRIPSAVDGTEVNPITLRSETPGGVIVTGNPGSNMVMLVEGDWWVIQDFWFKDIDNPATAELTRGIFTTGTDGVRFTNNKITNFNTTHTASNETGWMFWVGNTTGSTNTRIDHNTFDTVGSMFVELDRRSTNSLVDHNYFSRFGATAIQIGGDVYDRHYDTNNIIEYNVFEDSEEDGVHLKTSSNTIRYNSFTNCDGIQMRFGQDHVIHSNYMQMKGTPYQNYAILVSDAGHKIYNNYIEGATNYFGAVNFYGTYPAGEYFYANNVLFVNNTIVDSSVPGVMLGRWTDETVVPNAITFKNNIITQSTDSIVRCYEATNINFVSNLHFATGAASYWLDSESCSQIYTGVTKSDPNLIQGIYMKQLQASSSNAIGMATADVNVTVDIEGQPRGTTSDSGADEYDVGVIVNQTAAEIIAGAGIDWEESESESESSYCNIVSEATGIAGSGYTINADETINKYVGVIVDRVDGYTDICQIDINVGSKEGDVSTKTYNLEVWSIGVSDELIALQDTLATFVGADLPASGWYAAIISPTVSMSANEVILLTTSIEDAINYLVWDVDTTAPEADWQGSSRWSVSKNLEATVTGTDMTMRVYATASHSISSIIFW